MQNLISLFKSSAKFSELTVIANLMYLRLAVLILSLLSLLLWHTLVETYRYWEIVVPGLAISFSWTLYVLVAKSEKHAAINILREILFDYAWVFALVYFAGRAANPFIYYYLVLTALSAALLPKKQAWYLCALGIAAYSSLLLMDVKAHFSHFSTDYRIHLIGMWINYVGGTTVICLFVSRLIGLVRERDKQLAMTRETNLKNEQLIALATISATTMHDLATPLSTLSMLANELVDLDTLDSNVKNDLLIMQSQVKRCNKTMKDLSNISQKNNELAPIPVSELVSNISEHYALHYPNAKLDIHQQITSDNCINSNLLFQYALVNLINNALEATRASTKVNFVHTKANLSITIQNESQQTQESLLARWGKTSESDKQSGLGIGSLLANSTIEQQGGSVELRTAPVPDNIERLLVVVHVHFPLINR